MSKNKQNKQPSKFWTGTKQLLRTLFSNDACVDKRESHWWSAIIVGLVSIMIAVAPYSYYNWKTKGGDFLTEPTYGIKEGLIAFAEDASKKSDLAMDVNTASNTLEVTGWAVAYPTGHYDYSATFEKETVVTTVDSSGISSSISYDKTTVTEVRFSVYYINASGDDFKTDYKNILGGADANGNTTYSVSTIFFGNDCFYATKKPSGTSSTTAAMIGKYDDFKNGFSIKDLAKQDINGKAYSISGDAVTEANYTSYFTQATAAWTDFFTGAYSSTSYANGWLGTGIAWAIDVGLVFLMGLMLFLMTRGKSNPYRIYTFWQSQKMGYWATLSPALLAMIIGFIWNNSYSLFFFLFLYGLRIMWMSMHSLSPNYQK